MRYLVIGGAGFIGSHVVEKLLAKGHEVVVMDNLVSGRREFVPKEVEFRWGDIRSPRDLDRVFTHGGDLFHRVINLAAQPYIPNCYDDPELFFETNANGTLNVLRACERHLFSGGRVLQYASAEEYGTQKGRINEDVAVHPQSPTASRRSPPTTSARCATARAGSRPSRSGSSTASGRARPTSTSSPRSSASSKRGRSSAWAT